MQREERQLWDAYRKTRSDEDRNKIFEYHYDTIVLFSRKSAKRSAAGMDVWEAVSHAAERVLNKTIPDFDPDMGIKFETYLWYHVIGSISDATRNNAGGRGKYNRALDSSSERYRLGSEIGARPTDAEVAESLGRKEKWVIDADRPIISFCDPSLLTKSTKNGHTEDGRISIEYLTHKLKKRSRWVVEMYYVEGYTLGEIARKLGVSQSRVSQIVLAAMKIMRKAADNHFGITTK